MIHISNHYWPFVVQAIKDYWIAVAFVLIFATILIVAEYLIF